MLEYNPINIRTWSLLGTCGTLGIAACELPKIDENVVILTADLRNFSGLKRFSQEYPDKFFNVGICEQNMIGIASGLTKEGFNPFVTSYAGFATLRCADQIKFNLAYMQRPVKIIGTTSGLNSSIAGGTHLSLEDIALMRAFPNITVISPADCTETMKAIIACVKLEKPVYIRLSGLSGTPIVYKKDFNFEIGRAVTVREGEDIVVFATGSMVNNSLKAANILEQKGFNLKVVDIHTINPIDKDVIFSAAKSKLIVSIEEHSRKGGLGSAIAEVLTLEKHKAPHLIIGTEAEYKTAAGYSHMLEKYGLSPEKIAENILKTYEDIK